MLAVPFLWFCVFHRLNYVFLKGLNLAASECSPACSTCSLPQMGLGWVQFSLSQAWGSAQTLLVSYWFAPATQAGWDVLFLGLALH